MESIDLNKKKGRNIVEITVADQVFRIVKVVTGVRQIYNDYMLQTAEALEKIKVLDGMGEEDEGFREKVKQVSSDVEAFAEKKRETFFRMLDLILSRNGYTLDRDWWEENSDEVDQQGFLEICLMKDSSTEKKTT